MSLNSRRRGRDGYQANEQSEGSPKNDKATPILQHPRRRLVIAMRATMAGMKQPSIRAASKAVAAMVYGNEVEHEGLPPEASEVIAASPPGMVTLVCGPHRRGNITNTRRGVNAGTIAGAAEDIRQLDRQARREAAVNPDVARWLRCGVQGLVTLQDPFAPKDLIIGVFRNSGDPELEAIGQELN
jgi:hypothetical protein